MSSRLPAASSPTNGNGHHPRNGDLGLDDVRSPWADPRAVVHGHNNGRMSYSSAANGRHRSRSSSDDQSLMRYWSVLRERVWVIVVCTVLVFAAAVAYVELAPKTYTAQA